jgi:hypothetical protein
MPTVGIIGLTVDETENVHGTEATGVVATGSIVRGSLDPAQPTSNANTPVAYRTVQSV